jgi:hypothetical protein
MRQNRRGRTREGCVPLHDSGMAADGFHCQDVSIPMREPRWPPWPSLRRGMSQLNGPGYAMSVTMTVRLAALRLVDSSEAGSAGLRQPSAGQGGTEAPAKWKSIGWQDGTSVRRAQEGPGGSRHGATRGESVRFRSANEMNPRPLGSAAPAPRTPGLVRREFDHWTSIRRVH